MNCVKYNKLDTKEDSLVLQGFSSARLSKECVKLAATESMAVAQKKRSFKIVTNASIGFLIRIQQSALLKYWKSL